MENGKPTEDGIGTGRKIGIGCLSLWAVILIVIGFSAADSSEAASGFGGALLVACGAAFLLRRKIVGFVLLGVGLVVLAILDSPEKEVGSVKQSTDTELADCSAFDREVRRVPELRDRVSEVRSDSYFIDLGLSWCVEASPSWASISEEEADRILHTGSLSRTGKTCRSDQA